LNRNSKKCDFFTLENSLYQAFWKVWGEMYTSEKNKTEIVDCLIVARVVGYDDKMKIKNSNLKGPRSGRDNRAPTV
jgi:hypothetical protein